MKNTTQKVSKTMSLLRRFKTIFPRSSLLTIYKTFIQFEYADFIFENDVIMKIFNLSNIMLDWQ